MSRLTHRRRGAAAIAAAGSWRKLVFGVSASDPLTLVVVSATLAFVALMASLVPRTRHQAGPVGGAARQLVGSSVCRSRNHL